MGFKVSVSGHIGEEKYLTTLTSGEHTLISDEPIKFGGQNKGFNPFELLAASLAACTLATLRSYISRKKWKVPEIVVEVEFESFPKEERSLFKRYIDFKNAKLLPQETERLFEIAERCPVHKILQNEIEIFSDIKYNL